MQVYVDSFRSRGVSPTPLIVVGFFFPEHLCLYTYVLLLEEKAQYRSCTLGKSKATPQPCILLRHV